MGDRYSSNLSKVFILNQTMIIAKSNKFVIVPKPNQTSTIVLSHHFTDSDL